jgi:hypothetical protein
MMMMLLVLAAGAAQGGLVFSQPVQEVHAAADASSVTADFTFSNKSDRVASIRHYDAPCSCLAAQVIGGKLDYAPGEQGTVRAVFNLGNFSGTVDKQVVIWLNDDPDEKPSVVLTVRVHIPELVLVEPKTLKWSLGEKPVSKTIRIKIDSPQPVKVLGVSGSNERFAQQLTTVKEGAEYELKVTPTDTGTPGIGVLRIETDCPVARHRIRQAFLVVRRGINGA